jgi:hypothetical protein
VTSPCFLSELYRRGRNSIALFRTLYLNSEGTSYEIAEPLVKLAAGASTQAVDGMPLDESVDHGRQYGSSLFDMATAASRWPHLALAVLALPKTMPGTLWF